MCAAVQRWCTGMLLLQGKTHGVIVLTRLHPQAAARASEQQVASLEAALQRSSAAAVGMTEKAAHAMADASGQAEAAKVRAGLDARRHSLRQSG
jgi:hypothetical protein